MRCGRRRRGRAGAGRVATCAGLSGPAADDCSRAGAGAGSSGGRPRPLSVRTVHTGQHSEKESETDPGRDAPKGSARGGGGGQCTKITILLGCQSEKIEFQKDWKSEKFAAKCVLNLINEENQGDFGVREVTVILW